MDDRAGRRTGIGNRIAPPRFLAFAVLAGIATAAGTTALGWRSGVMTGFDLAAVAFLASCLPLLRSKAAAMRAAALRNDANRAGLLALTLGVTAVILIAIGAELAQKNGPNPATIALILVTLLLVWAFSTTVYALHYGHLYYLPRPGGGDMRGLCFPATDEPDYWDMLYFASTMSMTFQTSDVTIEGPRLRRVAMLHGLAAFMFNIGVLAFTINVLGGD